MVTLNKTGTEFDLYAGDRLGDFPHAQAQFLRSSMSVIRFQDVSKSFPRHRGHLLLREHLGAVLRGGFRERFYALKHISFEVNKGESLAVIGHNGAGRIVPANEQHVEGFGSHPSVPRLWIILTPDPLFAQTSFHVLFTCPP